MAENKNGPGALFGVATFAALVVIIGAAILIINHANGGDRTAQASPTPSISATFTGVPTPTPSSTAAAQIPFADCSKATFGSNLQPLNPPSDIHVYPAEPAMTIDTTKLYRVTIHTAKGDMVLCLQPDLAPHTVNNFVTLARNHFYDGLTFHRVVANFVIQGGDPKGTGSGGPGYTFNDEPVKQAYVIGAVAMANSGPNTNGSQFFIDIADDTSQLQPLYNLFGKLESGQNVANSIAQGDVMLTVTVAQQS